MRMPADGSRSVFTVAEVARVMGWQTQRMRRWLLRHGAAFKDGRFFYTSRDLLRAAFPEAWEDMIRTLPD